MNGELIKSNLPASFARSRLWLVCRLSFQTKPQPMGSKSTRPGAAACFRKEKTSGLTATPDSHPQDGKAEERGPSRGLGDLYAGVTNEITSRIYHADKVIPVTLRIDNA